MKHSLSAAFIHSRSSLTVLAVSAVTLAAATLSSTAQPSGTAQPPGTFYVYDGSITGAARVGSWGNGTAQPAAARGASALQVTTHSFYEGVRFDLNTPVDLGPYQQNGFWRIRVQMGGAAPFGGGRRNRPGAASSPSAPASTASTRAQAMVSTQSTRPSEPFTTVQFQQRPQRGNGQRGGVDNTSRQGGRTRQPVPTLTQLQLTAVLDRGTMSGRITINPAAGRNAGGGQTLLLPLRDMRSTPGAGGSVRRLILTGDRSATFGLEQIALVTETNQITASIRRTSDAPGTQLQEITVNPGRGTTLIADVEGGTSDVVVQWNFDADQTGAYPPPATAGAGRGAAARGNVTGPGGPGARGGTPGMSGTAIVPGAVPGAGMVVRPRVDAVGLSAQPNWPDEEQNYRVEITVTDRSGKKAPVKASLIVKTRTVPTR